MTDLQGFLTWAGDYDPAQVTLAKKEVNLSKILRLDDSRLTQQELGLQLDLMPFQWQAVRHVFSGRTDGYALFLEMGLGKTFIAIAVASALNKHFNKQRITIVVPPSLRLNWVKEIQKLAPHLTVGVLEGTTPAPLPNVDILIIGNDARVLDGWSDTLINGDLSALIVDESHHMKEYKSKRTKVVKLIAESVSTLKVIMTGTPIPNGRATEFVSQFDICGPISWAEFGGPRHFRARYAPVIDGYGKRGNANADELEELMRDSFVLKMYRRDHLKDLPNKGRSIVSLECKNRASKEYKSIEDDLFQYLMEQGKDIRKAEKAEALIRLGLLRRKAGEAKVEPLVKYVKEILSTEPGGVFVVAENRDVISALMDGLKDFRPAVVQGGMSDKDKDSNVEAFCTGYWDYEQKYDCRVMVGQIVAAGVGLTLHGAGRNRRVVIAQLPWSPDKLLQAEDRLCRIGQTKEVQVEIALAAIDGSWTIDERLWGLLESKYFNTEVILKGDGAYLGDYNIDDGMLSSYQDTVFGDR